MAAVTRVDLEDVTEATSSARRSALKMKEKLKNAASAELGEKDIMAGYKFNMQYLGSREALESGGSDSEIANVIHDIHTLYARRNTKLKKARDVVVFVDFQKINVLDKDEGETYLSFPLALVKDVTTCLNQPPYSKTCVLVAKQQYNEPLYKAYVFYCKSERTAAQFYHVTKTAFQVGFKRLQMIDAESKSQTDGLESSKHGNGNAAKSNRSFRGSKKTASAWGSSDEEIGEASTSYEFEENWESEILLKPRNGISAEKNQEAVTVRLSDKENCSARDHYEKGLIKIDFDLGNENSGLKRSKFSVYMDTVEESSQFISKWFRNSYRKFRRFSGQGSSTGENNVNV